MREVEFFWCRKCKELLKSGVDVDICPKCNSSLDKGKIFRDKRKELFFALGLTLLLQFPIVLVNQIPVVFGPMIYGNLTMIQLLLSILLFIVGIIVVGSIRLLRAYPYSVNTEKPIDLQIGFRDQILVGEVCCYTIPFIAVIYVTVSLLALYLGQTLFVV